MRKRYYIPVLGLYFCINDHSDFITVITSALVSWCIPFIILLNLFVWRITE